MNPRDLERPKRDLPSLLDDVLEQRMFLYVLAAGAALATSPVMQAKVIFTPYPTNYKNGVVDIDLNHDGTTDFTFFEFNRGGCGSETRSYCSTLLNVRGAQTSNLIEQGARGEAALTRGAQIGSGNAFANTGYMAELCSDPGCGNQSFGSWAGVTNKFMGVKFLISGQVHYGWIGFRSVSIFGTRFAGWAYETVPNQAILAGNRGESDESGSLPSIEATSLRMLAMGHTAIADWQRRSSIAAVRRDYPT